LLTYKAEAKVGGKIAQLGGRLIHGFAKKMADQFFDKFQETVGAPDAPSEASEGDADTKPAEDGDGNKKGWLGRIIG
ncbi:MAG: SRPBCC domain-containing protein, partial [Pseudomonadota bacterium]